jgi:hypothetical protein
MKDVAIDALLADLGLTDDAAGEARRILETAGITNPRKQRMRISKIEAARAEIDAHMRRLCHSCIARLRDDGRTVSRVPVEKCSNCGGSSNRRAVDDMVDACRRAGLARIVFVGGSPSSRNELAALVDERIELRLVDGTRSPDRAAARRDIAWADLIVVLGATQLAHKVSTLYTRDPDARAKLITTSRRGIEAVADEVTRSDAISGARNRSVLD